MGTLSIPGDYLVQVEGPLCGNPVHTWRLPGPGGGPPLWEPCPYLATIWSGWRAPCVGTLAIPGDYLVQMEGPLCGTMSIPGNYLVQVEGPLCGNPVHTWRLSGPGGGDPSVGTLSIPGDYLVQVEGPLCGNPGHTWRLSGPGGGPPV